MAWDRPKPSRWRACPAAAGETRSPQPWACSSLSSSENFRSLYDKMLEGSIDWEKKNFESLVCTRCLQQVPEQPPPVIHPVQKYGSSIVSPQIITRGSVVGKKVYCSSSINTSMKWRQKNSSQRIHNSMMFLDFNQQRSGITLSSARQEILPGVSLTSLRADNSVGKGQCRGLLLGMRMICPPLQLPLLEILLFSHQQLYSVSRVFVSKGGGLWRFPLYLALATIRPFCGSLVRRCLTAVVLVSQLRSKNNPSKKSLTYVPDLYSVTVFENGNPDLKFFSICSKRIQVDDRRTTKGIDVAGQTGQKNVTIVSDEGENFTEMNVIEFMPRKDEPIKELEHSPLKIQAVVESGVGDSTELPENGDVSIAGVESEEFKMVPTAPTHSQPNDDVVSAVASENSLTSHKRLRDVDSVVGSRKRLQIYPVASKLAKEGMSQTCIRTIESLSSSSAELSSDLVEVDSEAMSESRILSTFDVGVEEPDDSKIASCATLITEAFLERGESTSSLQTMHGSQKVVELNEESCFPSEEVTDVSTTEPPFRSDFVIAVEDVKSAFAMHTVQTVAPETSPAKEILSISSAEPLEDAKCEDSTERFLKSGNEEYRDHGNEFRPREGLIETHSEACLFVNSIADYGLDHHTADREIRQDFEERGGGASLLVEGVGFLSSPKKNSRENELDHSSQDSLGEWGVDDRQRDDIYCLHSVSGGKSSHLYEVNNEFSTVRSSCDISSGATTNRSIIIRLDSTIETQGQLLEGAVSIVHQDTNVGGDTELFGVSNVEVDRHEVSADLSECSSEIIDGLSRDSCHGFIGIETDNDDHLSTGVTQIACTGLTTTKLAVGERDPPLVADDSGISEDSNSSSGKCTAGEANHATVSSTGLDTKQDLHGNPKKFPSSSSLGAILCGEGLVVPVDIPKHPFADHPACVESRERRHSHGDQTYIDMQELLPAPWGRLIFWHGRCKEGRPTLCVLLGKAVRELPSQELKRFIAVTVSHLEYAELNFFKGSVKQLNIVMDLEGLGFMRLPPMNIISSIGAALNRDYAGRGEFIMLVNAPVMLGFVISAIQGGVMRKKGAADNASKGFLEGKDRIMMGGCKYRPTLQVRSKVLDFGVY